MWMLLRAEDDQFLPQQPGATEADGFDAAPVGCDDAATEGAGEVPTADSDSPDGAVLAGSPARQAVAARATLYLHPGRLGVGEMDAAAASEQFSFESSPVYVNLAEAEHACEGRSGFLVEISGPFTNSAGDRFESGVRFAAKLA